ncbi:porin [Anaeromyxobacter terrae]|uniref:porin n=1 Tax=Anaeromyxobacter terrae TaxID=2925406 RepID=UPI001F580E4A|nr:porin [Anaeromyxobacter sp. SG22]
MILAALVLASAVAQASPASAPPPTAPPAPASTVAAATDRAAPPPAYAPRPVAFGYLDFQLSSTDRPGPAPGVSTAEFRRARIGIRGEVLPRVGYTVLFDAADTSLKDAYVALRLAPRLELRLGQFKTPFGYEQAESDTKLLWVYNSYVVAALARGRDSRDLGALLTGKFRLSSALDAELATAAVDGAGPNAKDDLNEKNVWGRAGVALSLGRTVARAGGSYGYGHQVQSLGADGKFGTIGAVLDDTYAYFHTAGADLTLETPWFFGVAELIESRRRVRKYASPATVAASDQDARGWYAGFYGKTPWSVGPVFRVEQYDPNDAGSARGDRYERYTLGAYYDLLSVNARLVANYELDRSDRPVRTGNRLIALAQVVF